MVCWDRVDFDPSGGETSPAEARVVESSADPVRGLFGAEEDDPSGVGSGLIPAPGEVVDLNRSRR